MNRSHANFSLCVYCGARPGHRPAFAQAAQTLGRWIGEHGGRLVYGGGRGGLMGIVADATLAAGGQVLGIIPRALMEREHAHRGCTELVVVETMHERKRLMAEHCDAFMTLPGGIGTFEEFFEAWTWAQLGYHAKPIGLLNLNGYYDGLLAFVRSSVANGFMDDGHLGLLTLGQDPVTLACRLVEQAGFAPPAQLQAV